MAKDAAPGARQVRLEMHSRKQMRDVYGRVVYQKGAATLAMLEHWLGDAAFQRGLQSYLNEHKFSTATTADFVHVLFRAAGQDVGEILSGLFDRPGVPVVTAEIRCGSGSPRVALRQDQDSRIWRLPVCLKVAGGSERCLVMDGRETEVVLTEVGACPSWVFPNAGASGYYRTRLSPELLLALWREGTGQLTAAERLTLALDMGALYANGTLTPAQIMDLLPIMAQDTEPLVALAALDLAGVLSGF
jgi:cytosol alanyl aminopeptidase